MKLKNQDEKTNCTDPDTCCKNINCDDLKCDSKFNGKTSGKCCPQCKNKVHENKTIAKNQINHSKNDSHGTNKNHQKKRGKIYILTSDLIL